MLLRKRKLGLCAGEREGRFEREKVGGGREGGRDKERKEEKEEFGEKRLSEKSE